MGGSGSSSGRSGGAGGAGNAQQSYVQRIAGKMRQSLSAEGMSSKAIEKYIKNEDMADQLERELNAELYTSSNKHSIGWRTDMQERISRLREENDKLRYGG